MFYNEKSKMITELQDNKKKEGKQNFFYILGNLNVEKFFLQLKGFFTFKYKIFYI